MATLERGNRTAVSVAALILPKEDLGVLFNAVKQFGNVYGPVEKEDSTVMFGEVCCPSKLKMDYFSTMISPKKFLHKAIETLFHVKLGDGFSVEEDAEAEKQVLFGVHACDAAAIMRLDQVFSREGYEDPYYLGRRDNTLIVVNNCTKACQNGFCDSMGTGPMAKGGYDLALTDLGNKYLVEAGTKAGVELIGKMNLVKASETEISGKAAIEARVIESLPKSMKLDGLTEVLNNEVNSPIWAEVKEDCMGCANCTMVCPTCFCYNVTDNVGLDLTSVERVRTWDSCLLMEFSEVHGGNFRKDRAARIKQFIYHKLNYWVPQFNNYGCVGCGRCISWCPKKIDITEIIAKVRGEDNK